MTSRDHHWPRFGALVYPLTELSWLQFVLFLVDFETQIETRIEQAGFIGRRRKRSDDALVLTIDRTLTESYTSKLFLEN